MRFTSPSRRTLGLLAVSAIGMSTAVLGVTGVASAAPAVITGDDRINANTEDGDTGLTIPAGYCTARVQVDGASGGASSGDSGSLGDQVAFTMALDGGEQFTFAGGAGGAAGGDDLSGTSNGAGGVNPDAPSLNGGPGAPGGGGGAGAQVLVDGTVVAGAAGGDGAGALGGAGGGTTQVSPQLELPYNTDPQVHDSAFAGSYVGVTAYGCEAPDQPYLGDLQPRDGAAVVFFTAAIGNDDFTADASGYQYRVDGGSWVSLDETDLERGWFTVPNLTNGTTYSITMQTLSEVNGPSEVSDAGTVTPFAAPGAPTVTAVRTAPSQITVSWTPSEQGTYPIAGYGVYWGQGVPTDESEGQGGHGVGGTGCETGPSATSCTFFVPAGADYQVGVYSFDTERNYSGAGVEKTGITVPGSAVPASVPTQDNGDVVGPAGPISKLTAGQKVTLQGTGYAPNSTVTLVVYSSPVTLGTVVADQNGNFSVEVTVPANLANGTHHLVATGVDRDGNVRNLVITVTVDGGVATLATTGFDAVPVAVGGALVVLVGGGLLVGARRRSDA